MHDILRFLLHKGNKLKTCSKTLTLSIINKVLVEKKKGLAHFHQFNPPPSPHPTQSIKVSNVLLPLPIPKMHLIGLILISWHFKK